MGKQRKIRQLWREMKQMQRKNQHEELLYSADQYDVFPAKESMFDEKNVELDLINEEFDEIYEIVMPNLPFFSGINYEPWETEMKKLLWIVDLLHYDHEGCVNFYDKRRGAIALQLIISAVDENILSSILREFGEIPSAKIFWDILEMKYSMKWSEKTEVDEDIVVENDDCVEIFVTEIEIENDSIEIAMIDDESVFVADKDKCKKTHENEILMEESLFETKTYEVKFDENYSSHEEWSNLLHEKHLIDELLFGEKRSSIAYVITL
jgi:hypothetical protein